MSTSKSSRNRSSNCPSSGPAGADHDVLRRFAPDFCPLFWPLAPRLLMLRSRASMRSTTFPSPAPSSSSPKVWAVSTVSPASIFASMSVRSSDWYSSSSALVDQMSGDFDPAAFEDEYQSELIHERAREVLLPLREF